MRTTTASDGTHLSGTDLYGLSEYAAPVPGEPGTIVVSHNGRWLQLVTPTGVVDTADDLESPRAVAMVSGGPGEAAAVVATSLGLDRGAAVTASGALRFGPATALQGREDQAVTRARSGRLGGFGVRSRSRIWLARHSVTLRTAIIRRRG